MDNYTTSSTNVKEQSCNEQGKISRQQARHAKRQEAKRSEHLSKIRRRIALLRDSQAEVIQNSELTDEEKREMTASLNVVLIAQVRSGIFSNIKGFPKTVLDALQSPESVSQPAEETEAAHGTMLHIPSTLEGFIQTEAKLVTPAPDKRIYVLIGRLQEKEARICTHCGCKMHVKENPAVSLKHIPVGGIPSVIIYPGRRYVCSNPDCRRSHTQEPSFKADRHRITKEAEHYVRTLLSQGFNLKDTAQITGIGKNIIKEIDLARLKEKYTVDGKELRKPERQAAYLGIDEFKLHNGRRYATIITDLESGHALWLQPGKKKQVVYDFIEHVGSDWMKGVRAVACDMNSDFQEAFEERCPHIRVVFDHFHLVKNFNEIVIDEVRKEEQSRLEKEGRHAEAARLKRSKYILTSGKKTLKKKDKEAAEGKVVRKGTALFKEEDYVRKGGYVQRYEKILSENKLFFTCDLIKEKLADAYALTGGTVSDRLQMGRKLNSIIRLCEAADNEHFQKFAGLMKRHYKGLISHATFPISSGKVEGINQKIKTVRRECYGIPDDEYFFLKIMDFTRREYVRNPKTYSLSEILEADPDIRSAVARSIEATTRSA